MDRISNNTPGYLRAYDTFYVQKTQQKNTLDEKNFEKGKQGDSVQISKGGLSVLEEGFSLKTINTTVGYTFE